MLQQIMWPVSSSHQGVMHECHLDMPKRVFLSMACRQIMCYLFFILDSAAYINNRAAMDRGFHNHDICQLLFQIVMY